MGCVEGPDHVPDGTSHCGYGQDRPGAQERRREQNQTADALKASGALDDIFARIDVGEPLTGH